MACLIHNVLKEKKESFIQKAAVFAPSVLELISQLDKENIDTSEIKKSVWGSGMKHIDEIADIFPEVVRNWLRTKKQKQRNKKLPVKQSTEDPQSYIMYTPQMWGILC